MSRDRVPGDGPKCWCGAEAVFSGYCSQHCGELGNWGKYPPIGPTKTQEKRPMPTLEEALRDNAEGAKALMKAYPILEWFNYQHLPPDLQEASKLFHALAWQQAYTSWVPAKDTILSGFAKFEPELAEGLRKLLEAKDCFVRARKKLL